MKKFIGNCNRIILLVLLVIGVLYFIKGKGEWMFPVCYLFTGLYCITDYFNDNKGKAKLFFGIIVTLPGAFMIMNY